MSSGRLAGVSGVTIVESSRGSWWTIKYADGVTKLGESSHV